MSIFFNLLTIKAKPQFHGCRHALLVIPAHSYSCPKASYLKFSAYFRTLAESPRVGMALVKKELERAGTVGYPPLSEMQNRGMAQVFGLAA